MHEKLFEQILQIDLATIQVVTQRCPSWAHCKTQLHARLPGSMRAAGHSELGGQLQDSSWKLPQAWLRFVLSSPPCN